MNIAICDDNAEAVKTVEMYLDKLSVSKSERDIFYSGEDLIEAYQSNKAGYDVIFLDMEMKGINGIETAKQIRTVDKHVLVVFVTSHKKYMEESFECSPFRYLLKPVKYKKFKEVYDKICIKLNEEPETVVFCESRERIRIPCEDIMYFKINGHNLVIYKQDGSTHKIRKTMNELMDILNGSAFVQSHRSYAVNMAYVHKLGINYITMHNCSKLIPISDTYRDDFEQKFLNYRERKYVL